jgi:tetratricopeptide (TPR) repeat protein
MHSPATVTETLIRPGRNESCPCGSGKKYKRCCGSAADAAPPARLPPPPAGVPNPLEIGALVALVEQARLTEAEHGTRALLRQYPAAGMLWKILSVALMRQGKYALEALRRTAELLPSDAEAHRNLGAALEEQGQPALALKSLRRALELAPNDVDCLVETADLMRAVGRDLDAVPLYSRALQRDPGRVEARNNLGNAFLKLARFADAAASYRRALLARPNEPQILFNLSNAERQLGNLDEAADLSRRAIALDPNLSVAHNNLGLILAAQGHRDAAVSSYRRALALNPNYVEALNHLGNVLFELRRTEEAMAAYVRALELKPDYAPAHLSLAFALRQRRRPDEAESSCRAALAIDPNYVEALTFLGELEADHGRFAEAEALFQRAIVLKPDYYFPYFSIATHRRMTGGDGAWLQGVESLLNKSLPLSEEISLRYALGKYFDDLKQYETAFGHYRQANELTRRYGATFDRTKLARRVDEVIHRFDAAFLRQVEGQGAASELPILIVGMPRSGTSLAEQILASHPAVFGAGEVIFWDTAFELQKGTALVRIAQEYLDRLTAVSGGARRVVDKMPANFMYAGLIHAALPKARIIHMRRHPIDTCLSIYFQNFFSMGPYANDFADLAYYYGQYVRITDHWRAVLPSNALLEIPYEALVADQEGWTRRMLDFVGLPWDPACLDFQNTERVVITASKWQVRQKIHSASAGRWRHYEPWLGPLKDALTAARVPYG